MMRFVWLILLLSLRVLPADATIISQSLYINKGLFPAVDSTFFPFYGLNQTNQFDPRGTVIQAVVGDTVEFMVHNSDVDPHELRIWHTTHAPIFQPVLRPGDSALYVTQFHEVGVFILYDERDFPKYSYMGLTATIVVTSGPQDGGGMHGGSSTDIHGGKYVYWNIRENEKAFNYTLSNGGKVDWAAYEPDYFTINGQSYPQTHSAGHASVEGKVGDTLFICIANSGQSVHSLHFHGYHTVAVYSSDPTQLGWEKDTWRLTSYQTLVLRLIPDKPGLYPVHDHNLVALTGGGQYPNGMLVLMDIKP